jgi:hypothetical protein
MKRFAGLFIAAACAAFGADIAAQAPQQAPSPDAKATAPAAEVVITGCVQTEAAYRTERNKARGGTLGTGLGQGNEFVLIQASPSRSATEAVGTAGAAAAESPAGTMSYELSGKGEPDAAKFVNQRVEITGTLKAEQIGRTGPTGGPTAGLYVPGEDLKLRELDVASVRAISGSCK